MKWENNFISNFTRHVIRIHAGNKFYPRLSQDLPHAISSGLLEYEEILFHVYQYGSTIIPHRALSHALLPFCRHDKTEDYRQCDPSVHAQRNRSTLLLGPPHIKAIFYKIVNTVI